MPMTEPPAKAMERALFMPDASAALAVRTLARVATFIPKKPARMEQSAPSRKHRAVPQLIKRPIRINRAATKKARILYSDFRKASAPSAMEAAISCIRSLPGEATDT